MTEDALRQLDEAIARLLVAAAKCADAEMLLLATNETHNLAYLLEHYATHN
jgi:hypothetical protein